MRRLVYVPIIHSETDLGSLAGRVREAYAARFGADAWERHARAIEEMWRGIRERIFSMGLEYSRVRIYQDGLPACGPVGPACGAEASIVKDLAGRGSLNHQLVAHLMDLGATLVGTEDPRLLLREYEEMKRRMEGARGARTPVAGRASLLGGGDTLVERDRFIARRIGSTLGDGETGVLFMGLAHHVERFLPGDMKIDLLIHRLPFGAESGNAGGTAGRRHSRRSDAADPRG